MSLRIASKRLAKELMDLQKSCPDGLELINTDNLQCWTIAIDGLGVYEGDRFALRFKFSDRYPIGLPSS
jgi:ubiquitin-conjugating enzyme E2 W